jgi:hypothetical protein
VHPPLTRQAVSSATLSLLRNENMANQRFLLVFGVLLAAYMCTGTETEPAAKSPPKSRAPASRKEAKLPAKAAVDVSMRANEGSYGLAAHCILCIRL